MKANKMMAMAILSATSICLSSSLFAWERSASENCKKKEANCKKEVNKCERFQPTEDCGKKSDDCDSMVNECTDKTYNSDQASFSKKLSPKYQEEFQKMTDDQKKRAMDNADNNKMNPDAAVQRVLSEDYPRSYYSR